LIILREATIEDELLLFKWRNDPDVRKNSFNSNQVKYEDHIHWVKDKLVSNNSTIYIIENDKRAIGVIRLDKIDINSKMISFSIDCNCRGKGYASQLLELIRKRFCNYILIGKVKKDNIGSIKAFLRAGYYMKEESEHLVFYSEYKSKR